jgi:cytochrome c oxidase cbb3-type subunit 3
MRLLAAALLSAMLLIPRVSCATPSGEGKKLYLSYCAACHGTDGKGDGRVAELIRNKPTDLTRNGFLLKKSDKELKDAIRGSEGVFHGRRYLPSMKVDFSAQEVFALINYIRSFQKPVEGDPIEGRKLYVAYCSECHGRNGRGDGRKARYLGRKLRDQSDDDYMSLKTDKDLYNVIIKGGGAAHGAKFMPEWRDMLRPQEVWDIVSYMRFLHRGKSEEGDPEKGRSLFTKYCASCHGESGDGEGPMADILTPRPKSLLGSDIAASIADVDLFFTIMGGGRAMGLSDQMPAWGGVLSEREVWDIVRYIRALN